MLTANVMLAVRNHSVASLEMMPGVCWIERLFPRLEWDQMLVANTNQQHSEPHYKSTECEQLCILICLVCICWPNLFSISCVVHSEHTRSLQEVHCSLSSWLTKKIIKNGRWSETFSWKHSIFHGTWTPVKHFLYCVFPVGSFTEGSQCLTLIRKTVLQDRASVPQGKFDQKHPFCKASREKQKVCQHYWSLDFKTT